MRGGVLNEVVDILKPQLVKDEYGSEVTEYVLKIHTRAKVEYQGGKKTTENDEVLIPFSKTFKLRIYHEIDDFDQIQFQGKRYRILSIDKDRHRQEQTITTEVIND